MERPQRLPALQEPVGELMAARSLLRLALALLLACAGLPVSAQLPTHGVNTRALLLAGDFAALERLYQTESAAAAPVTRRIGVELAPFYFYYSLELGVTPANWPQDDKATRAWLEMAVVLPARMAKLTSATDWMRPSSVSNAVLRWRTSSRFTSTSSGAGPAGRGCRRPAAAATRQ